jgi:ABC-type bacteriocin/lantibiotic exporter with double-glycine peptidase domain
MDRTTQREISQKYVRLLKLIRPFWLSLSTVILVGVIIQAFGLVVPYFSQLLIDRAYPNHNVSLMQVLVGAVVGVNIATVVMRNARSYFNLRLFATLNNTIGLMFFNHIQHLPARFFNEHRTGEIMSRFQDINTALNIVVNSFQTILMNGVYLIFVPPLLFLFNWQLALLALFTVPVNIYITYRLGHVTRPYLKQTAEGYAELRGVQIEIVSNIKSLKTMALEPHSYQKVDGLMRDATKVQLTASRVGAYYGVINGLTRAASTALYTWVGWHMIFSGQLSLGGFIAFTTYVGYLYTPIAELITLFSDLQLSSVSFDRMFEYLDKSPEQDPALAKSPTSKIKYRLKGDIEFERVRFGYSPGKPVLKDINLTIKQGTINAIVGPSGSGKTSLLRLITGLDRPDAGRILVDGMDISEIPLYDLRRQVSVVWQEGGLIKGSILDNLTLGSESPSPEWVRNVVRLCRLDELIESLPQKYESEVAEKGSTLSAGQQQRVAIARALIRRTPILIFDEATANIDVETEMEILRSIFSDFRDQTIIFVSHRLTSAALADNIFIVESGHIAEAGTPDELLTRNGIYHRMQMQSGIHNRKEEVALVGD